MMDASTQDSPPAASEQVPGGTAPEQFLHFATRIQSFLVPLESVHRIISWIPPKVLPFVPDFIMGIIHFEGNLWVAIDLDVIMGHQDESRGGEYVLVRQGECRLALKVRHSRDIVRVPADHREKQGLATLPENCTEFVTVIRGEMAYCLNLAAFVQEFSIR